MKRWSAIINHSRTSGKPPQTAEFDWHADLQRYLAPESEAVQITIYRSWSTEGESPLIARCCEDEMLNCRQSKLTMEQNTDLILKERARITEIKDLLTELYAEQDEALREGNRCRAIEIEFEIKELRREEEKISGGRTSNRPSGVTIGPVRELTKTEQSESVRIPMSNRAGPPGRRPSGDVENARGRVPFLTLGRQLRENSHGSKTAAADPLMCADAISTRCRQCERHANGRTCGTDRTTLRWLPWSMVR